jgi:hypothetical protein
VNTSDRALAKGLGFMFVLLMLGVAGFVPGNAAVVLLAAALATGAVLLVVTVPPGTGFRHLLPHWFPGAKPPVVYRAVPDPVSYAEQAVMDGPPADAASYATAVSLLGDDELCAAWRVSRDALLLTDLPERRSQLVALRQAYLDEMEQRHPRGFAAWLASHGVDDPGKYIRSRRQRTFE